MRLVGYVRVSEETENPDNQKYALYEWVARNGHQLVGIYEDIGVSGALSPRERPGFKRGIEALELEKADGLVVYALDRIARSLVELVEVVRELEARGKVVISVRESWLQQLDPKIRSLVVAVLGWAGEMEREFIKERTREALKRVKAQGKRIGRPPKMNEVIAREAIKYVERGYTLKDAAKLLGVGYTTLAKYLTQQATLRALYYEVRKRARTRARR